jgi:hypothetical protein
MEGRILKHSLKRLAENADAILGRSRRKHKRCTGALEISHQSHQLPLLVGFGKGLDFRQVAEARMLIASRNLKNRMKVDTALFEPVRIALEDRFSGARAPIDLTALHCQVDLGPAEPNYKG